MSQQPLSGTSTEGLVPILADLPDDLPGARWMAVDAGTEGGGGSAGAGEVFDCVGEDFPEHEIDATSASPHFFRDPSSLVHGTGVVFTGPDAASVAAGVLRRPGFGECLGRSIAADFAARPARAELLTIDSTTTDHGHRVRFTGGTGGGIRPVELDIVVVSYGRRLGVVWFADSPHPFDPARLDGVIDSMTARVRAAGD